MDSAVSPALLDRYLIVPASLHLLLENAIAFGHLKSLENAPVPVRIGICDDSIRLEHPCDPRPPGEAEAQRLCSLENRVRTVLGKSLYIDRSSASFAVLVPLLPFG